MNVKISRLDMANLIVIRKSVSDYIKTAAEECDRSDLLVLDIAPQIYEGAHEHFKLATIETLDLNSEARATYTADICQNNRDQIPAERFDVVICTEVIEHTLRPFDAVDEIYRILKKGGVLFLSSPFNFRIHGPLPDCWRITEHGYKSLLKKFRYLEIDSLPTKNRSLMPLHYLVKAVK